MTVGTAPPVTIRAAQYDNHDLRGIEDVRRSVGWLVNTVKEQFRQVARGRRVLLVADHDRHIVGTITLEWRWTDKQVADGKVIAHISNLVVRPSQQRRGVGRALVNAAEEIAAVRGCTAVTIGVDEPNVYARELYERWGYRWLKVTRQPWGVVHILTRSLPTSQP